MREQMGQVQFTACERARLAECCKALGVTFAEFAHFAILQAVDECEGYGREAAQQQAEWDRLRASNGATVTAGS